MLSAFPYPGGKTPYANRLLTLFPDHDTYVEPFGGSASVLLNKPRSRIEIFNDLDDDIVHFFETVRTRRDELQEWLRTVPYAETQYERWIDEKVAGNPPNDPIERAGRWLYLQYTNFNGHPSRRAGFKRSGLKNEARSFRVRTGALDEVVERFQNVTITCEDYRDLLDRYDRTDTLAYLDPPYLNPSEPYYREAHGFDHAALVEYLADFSGYWIVSYSDLPDGLEAIATEVRTFDGSWTISNADGNGRKEAPERAVMNFDPDDTPRFSGPDQTTLTEATP